MLRYLRALADRDLALDRTMIPLGSCTMKLNATAEMEPITWPEWGRIHPFAPIEQAGGYVKLIDDLEGWLAEITGYDSVSLQPNAGSQGEFAGLIAIRLYHVARGEGERDVCLIPASAHGTNAASASMAGLRVVVVKCDDNGNVDLGDLERKATEHADKLAALMVTYPSTHGVYEEHIGDICAVRARARRAGVSRRREPERARRRRAAGQVRRRRVAHQLAQDVLHPARRRRSGYRTDRRARAPRGVPAEPSVATRRRAREWRRDQCGAVGIGGDPPDLVGLHQDDGRGRAAACRRRSRSSTRTTSRSASSAHYPVLYTGANGLIAHECIIDLRPITAETGRHGRRRREAAHRLRLPRADDVVPGRGHADDRADRIGGPGARSTASSTR